MATNQIDFTLNADTSSFETNINNSSKAIEKLSKNNNELNGSLEDVSKFMKETAKVNTDLTKAIKDLAKAFDDSISSTNKGAKALDDISKEAKDAANEIKKVSNATKDIEKNSKAGNIALEAIKDNLGSIPIAGNTLTRMLDGLEGSFSKLAVAGLQVSAIGGGILALGATIYGAYTQSEKFRDSIENFKNNAAIAFSPMLNTLEDIGDTIGVIIDGLNEWVKVNNEANGSNVQNTERSINEIIKSIEKLQDTREDEIKKINILYSNDQNKILEESQKIWNNYYQEIEKISETSIGTLIKRQREINNTLPELNKNIEELDKKLSSGNINLLTESFEGVEIELKIDFITLIQN